MTPRRSIAALAVAAYLVIVFSLVPAWAAAPSGSGAKKAWTVMVYMNGSDLESMGGLATGDLLELTRVGSSEEVNVVVETLGTAQWFTAGISSERNQRFYLERGRVPVVDARDVPSSLREVRDELVDLAEANPPGNGLVLVDDSLGPRSLADPAALTDFILWSMREYPAEKYALIFWNHGAGSVVGFGADELHVDEDGWPASLTVGGIRDALAAVVAETGTPLELVGFDACLMATVEVAHNVSSFARYMVASEEIEPGEGWDHTTYLDALVRNPAMDGAELGRIIVDAYGAQAGQGGSEYADIVTLSLVDLEKVDEVVASLEAFVARVGSDLSAPASMRRVVAARSKAESYGRSSQGDSFDLVDLGDLAQETEAQYPVEAAQLRAALDDAVLHQIKGRGKPDAHGLAVWLPYENKEQAAENFAAYVEATPFSEPYRSFVGDYVRRVFGEDLEAFERPEDAYPEDGPEDPIVIELVDAVPGVEFDDEGTFYWVEVQEAYREDVQEVVSVLAVPDEEDPDVYIFIGTSNDVLYDPESGLALQYQFDELFTLNGSFISIVETAVDENLYEWRIPALLDGRPVDILAYLDLETEEIDFVGAWPRPTGNESVAAKEVLPIEPGSEITPQFYYYDEWTGDEGYADGDPFILTGELSIDLEPIPPGEYFFGFELVSYNREVTYSDFITVEIEYEEDVATAW